MSRPRIRAARGFTLIELLVVISIIGVLVALAVTDPSSGNGSQPGNGSTQVSGVAGAAQGRSLIGRVTEKLQQL